MLAFGPVPSRRLGKSLGINNIPPKICSYSCVYCQLGSTIKRSIKRKSYYKPEKILRCVERKVDEAVRRGERIDYLTFVPDGEPTLDANLGEEIELLKEMNIPIAILTNSSIVWRDDVKEDLFKADLVSLKVDAITNDAWKKVNRPHEELNIDRILEGIVEFSKDFKGKLITETMLIDNVDYGEELEGIADFLAGLKLDMSYIAIPTRPPAEDWVKPPNEENINRAFQIFSKRLGLERVEYLIGYEGNAFAYSGNVEEDLLSITSVHPMREEGVKELLRKANADWSLIERMVQEGKLIELEYEGHKYYMRKLPSRKKEG
ncbi:MAG: radical SAM protein [Candidatus Asgardarchaeia archaeon]